MESYLNGENLIVSPGQVILKRKAVESLWAEKYLKTMVQMITFCGYSCL